MNEDLVIKKIINLEDRMTRVEEKVDIMTKKMDRFENGQDKMIAILERIDQERILTEHSLKKIEKQVDSNTGDITKIKVQFKMA